MVPDLTRGRPRVTARSARTRSRVGCAHAGRQTSASDFALKGPR